MTSRPTSCAGGAGAVILTIKLGLVLQPLGGRCGPFMPSKADPMCWRCWHACWAPSSYGHHTIKLGLMLQPLGGRCGPLLEMSSLLCYHYP